MFAILLEVLLIEIQEEIQHFAGWEGGRLRGTKIVNNNFVNNWRFLKTTIDPTIYNTDLIIRFSPDIRSLTLQPLHFLEPRLGNHGLQTLGLPALEELKNRSRASDLGI